MIDGEDLRTSSWCGGWWSPPHVQDYAIRLVLATHPQGQYATPMVNQFVRFGASPRGVQALMLAAKVRAMLDERYHVAFERPGRDVPRQPCAIESC